MEGGLREVEHEFVEAVFDGTGGREGLLGAGLIWFQIVQIHSDRTNQIRENADS